MLTLNDGRAELWQWDTGRTLAVDADCSQVHFSNKVFGRSIDVDVADGIAIIPDVLLQTDKELNVWAFVGTAENGYTKISKTFNVNRRNKPSDYVFTPADQITIQTIQRQIGDLADLTTEAKDTLVDAINDAARTGSGTDMGITGATVGQIAKIADVDASGVPTEWAPVDMPSGGSSDFVITGSLTEAGGITLDKTFAQLQEAVQAGKTALMRVDGGPTTITLPLAVKNTDISTEYDFSIGYFIDGRLNGLTIRVMESGPVLYAASTPTNNPDGTMPQVKMAAAPTMDMQIATKKYVDDHATVGPPGPAGAPGITPTIGDNGNWYLGEEDTGKPSRGATGSPGKDGSGMDVTGAKVGQIAKITAVDASGVPTAWAPVDMPSVEEWEDMGTIAVEDGTAYIQVDLPYPVKKLYIFTASSATAILSSNKGLRIATETTAYNNQFFGCTPSTYNGNTWSASIWLIDFTKDKPIQMFSVGTNMQASALPAASLFSNAVYVNTMTPQQFFIVPGSGATINASTWTIWGVKA